MVIYVSKWTHGVTEMSIFWSKSGVQRWSRCERTVNGIENLIWYSESQENLLSDTLHPPVTYSSSSGSILRLKIPNFHFFCLFLALFKHMMHFCRVNNGAPQAPGRRAEPVAAGPLCLIVMSRFLTY